MYPFQNILVVVDSSAEEQPVLDRAVALAQKHQARLLIVDVVPELSWPLKLLMPLGGEHLPERMAGEKGDRLKTLASKIRRQGVNARHKVLLGRSSIEIPRQVLRGKHDLVMKAAKGRFSRETGFLGSTAKGLLRNCPCTVLLLKADQTSPFQHMVASVDARPDDEEHTELNKRILDLASELALSDGIPLDVVSACGLWGESYLGGYSKTDEYQSMEASLHAESQQNLHDLASPYASIPPERVHLLRGEPTVEVPWFVRNSGADLLVLGTVARTGIAGLLLGNTAEMILAKIECSVLAVKPARFVSPVKLQARKKPQPATTLLLT